MSRWVELFLEARRLTLVYKTFDTYKTAPLSWIKSKQYRDWTLTELSGYVSNENFLFRFLIVIITTYNSIGRILEY